MQEVFSGIGGGMLTTEVLYARTKFDDTPGGFGGGLRAVIGSSHLRRLSSLAKKQQNTISLVLEIVHLHQINKTTGN